MTVIGAIMLAASLVCYCDGLPGGMWLAWFALVTVIGEYHWHDKAHWTVRRWARFVGLVALLTVMIIGIGVGYAYLKGVHGDVMDMISSNGTYLLVVYFAPSTALVALGGLIRALVLRNLTGQEPDEA